MTQLYTPLAVNSIDWLGLLVFIFYLISIS